MSLTTLPAELLHQIAEYLSGDDAHSLAMTSKRLSLALYHVIQEYENYNAEFHLLDKCEVWSLVPKFLKDPRATRHTETIQDDKFHPPDPNGKFLSEAEERLISDAIKSSQFSSAWQSVTALTQMNFNSHDLLISLLLTLLPHLSLANFCLYDRPEFLRPTLKLMPELSDPPLQNLTEVVISCFGPKFDMGLVLMFARIPSLELFECAVITTYPHDPPLSEIELDTKLHSLQTLRLDTWMSQTKHLVDLFSRLEGLEEIKLESSKEDHESRILLRKIANRFGSTLKHLELAWGTQTRSVETAQYGHDSDEDRDSQTSETAVIELEGDVIWQKFKVLTRLKGHWPDLLGEDKQLPSTLQNIHIVSCPEDQKPLAEQMIESAWDTYPDIRYMHFADFYNSWQIDLKDRPPQT